VPGKSKSMLKALSSQTSIPLVVVFTFVIFLVTEFVSNVGLQVVTILALSYILRGEVIQKKEERDVVLYLIGFVVVAFYVMYLGSVPGFGGILYKIGAAFTKLISGVLFWVSLFGAFTRLRD